MKLTPRARRLLSEAVEALPSRGDQATFRKWASSKAADTDIPYEIAAIALAAVLSEKRKIEFSLESPSLDEDAEADLLNDLGYVQAMEKSLRLEGIEA